MTKFTPGELQVMRLLWEHGEMKPAEIQDLFPEEIKNAALRSYLTILLEKGHISRKKVGKAYFYKTVTRKNSAFKSTLNTMIDAYCEGSMKNLVMSLIRSENLSEQELIELRKIAAGEVDEAKSESKPASTKISKRSKKAAKKPSKRRKT